MSQLPKYTLQYNEEKDKWDLEKDKTGRIVKSFETKEIATQRGVLKNAVGKEGGSVKIQKENGKYQEERTYPKSKDPKESRG